MSHGDDETLDPVTLSLLNAPEDDEPLTEEDLRAMAESEDDIRCGRVITSEQLRRKPGIELDAALRTDAMPAGVQE